MLRALVRLLLGTCLTVALACTSSGQTAPDVETVHPNLRVEVERLPSVVAKDTNASSVAKAAVRLALSGSKLTCAPDSEIQNVVESSADSSLASLVRKMSGTVCTSNGQIHKVIATYIPNGEIQSDTLIASIIEGKPLLVAKEDGIYVLYGVIYDEHLHSSGGRDNVIRELLLIDPRYSDQRRFTSLVRGKENMTSIAGVAAVTAN